MSESFFSRWSRRKLDKDPVPVDSGDGLLRPEVSGSPRSARDDALKPDHGETEGRHLQEPPAPLPTLEDVQGLTPQDDFVPFMRQGVTPAVRNAAMKKLFADPHFNVMDGLDIYIDDYSQPDPLPAGMLRRMASAQFMGLVPQEAPERQANSALERPLNPTPVEGLEVVAQSPDCSAAADPPTHDHPDLQLQPDPAAADPQPEPGPR